LVDPVRPELQAKYWHSSLAHNVSLSYVIDDTATSDPRSEHGFFGSLAGSNPNSANPISGGNPISARPKSDEPESDGHVFSTGNNTLFPGSF
jgi:hypothetical protein